MGQRSQIYVRYNKGENRKGLIANYYGWNYGERMISRARAGIEHICNKIKYEWYFTCKDNVTKLSRMLDTNFDMQDLQISCNILEEYFELFSEDDFNKIVFKEQDNNDGKLLIDICNDAVKYAFLDRDADVDSIMDAEAYMQWNVGTDWRTKEHLASHDVHICEENIKFISEHGTLMTKEEVEEFINYNYMNDFKEKSDCKTISISMEIYDDTKVSEVEEVIERAFSEKGINCTYEVEAKMTI